MLASSFTNAKTAKRCCVQKRGTAAFIAPMAQSGARRCKNSVGAVLEGLLVVGHRPNKGECPDCRSSTTRFQLNVFAQEDKK